MLTKKLILSNARVIDPAVGFDGVKDIAVSDGVLAAPESIAADSDTEVIDLRGKVVTPGLIDMHVHLREPGQEAKEDIDSGTMCAAVGGFTTVLTMPNTQPPLDTVGRLHDQESRIRETARVRVLVSGCMTEGRHGEVLTDISALCAETDIVCVTDDGDCIQDTDTMRAAMRLAHAAGVPVIDHCEDRSVMDGGVIRRGTVSEKLGVPGMPGETESNIVERNIELCRETGCAVHMQHLSYIKSIEAVRRARAEGLPVTAEAMPHHMLLTATALLSRGTNAKMNPPLGTEEDRQALLEAVADGTISVIATDHAPHTPHEKAQDMVAAPWGIIGLETAVPLCLTALVGEGIIDLPTLIARMTVGPADVLALARPSLAVGQPADVTVIDPDAQWSIDVSQTFSKSRNSPFDGYEVTGEVIGTMVGGAWAFEKVTGKGVTGKGVSPTF